MRLISVFLCLIVLASCHKEEAAHRTVPPARSALLMGTVCTINLFEYGSRENYDRIIERLSDIEQTYSIHIASSAISRINAAAGISPVSVSAEVFSVIQSAIEAARLTEGAFDPSIGPLVELWGIGSDHARLPSQQEIDALLPLVDYRLIEMDADSSSVFLPQKGMALDLGGIVKGFAADEIARLAADEGTPRALIDLGGNIYAFGTKANGTAWKIGIRNPREPDAPPAFSIDIEQGSVVTSGPYERFFDFDGVRYHHILDPKTGYPSNSRALSVSIISQSSITADALSTAVFVLGEERGFEALKQYPGTEAVFVSEEGSVSATEGIRSKLRILSDDYTEKDT